jgi:ABC-type dipeptide/oligopeptide/nickel transport system ATPase component
MSVSWVDFSIEESIKPFSLNLEKNDFLFLAGETCGNKLLLALAGFLPSECNSKEAIRINGQRINYNETFSSVLLPKDAAKSFPPHRTIEQFALDLAPDLNKKKLENYAAEYDIDRHILNSKPAKIPEPVLQKVSLWLCSLNKSSVIFVEEPENGFADQCRPFDFLQSLLRNDITESIVYLTDNKETIFQKAKIMQFCRARLAIFCADRLVEEGEAIKILENPIHFYTKEWISFGSSRGLKPGALWQYCQPNCPELHNCQVRQSVSYTSWDCEQTGLHKVICKGFFYFQ